MDSRSTSTNSKRGSQKKQDGSVATRSRNWAAVLYPESAAENWMDVIDDLHITAYVSPLHDKDTNPDGTPKKPHWHILLAYEGVKSFEQVKQVWDAIHAVPEPRPVNSLRGYARYLTHMDNPEKYQYAAADVRCFGGAVYSAAVALPTDDFAVLKQIIAFVNQNGIYSYAELIDVCIANGADEWFNALCTGTVAFTVREYMKSIVWETERGYRRIGERTEGETGRDSMNTN